MNFAEKTKNTGQTPSLYYEDSRIHLGVLGKSDLPPVEADQTDQSRRQLEKEILSRNYGLAPESIFFLKQVHGTQCWTVGPNHRQENPGVYFQEGDGLITKHSGLLLCIRTADCMPVFFYSTEGPPLAGIIHAGWRGLASGIFRENLRELIGANPARNLRFLVGPCIGGDSYEVGPEVVEHFSIHEKIDENHYLLDLRANILKELREVSEADEMNLSPDFEACTFKDNNLFFSHRKRDLGRNLNIIMIKAPIQD